MSAWIHRFLRDQSGATAMEYGLIVALIGVTIIGVVSAVGANLGGTLNTVSNTLAAR